MPAKTGRARLRRAGGGRGALRMEVPLRLDGVSPYRLNPLGKLHADLQNPAEGAGAPAMRQANMRKDAAVKSIAGSTVEYDCTLSL